mmetsp:Transcript_24471/g.56356  ORF Transcript_24471/g.56356 Transcript_24471/m.56356 type:complete len:796 (+) Transcript_24471:59-2446(+)
MAAAASSAPAAAPATDKSKSGECVKVVIRCRPMSSQEQIDGRENIVEFDIPQGVARVRRPGTKDYKDFTFDAVYEPNTRQEKFYDDTGYAIVENVMDGYNGTIFAYGQTGTGKTFTMVGTEDAPELKGVIPRTFEHIFRNINITSGSGKRFLVRASYLEIYNEEIRDLLSKNPKAKLDLKDHPDGGVYVKDLSNLLVQGPADLEQVMQVGIRKRSVASTLMNNESSRSHSIFTITIETAETGADGQEHIRVGKMNMVDLAGSERQSKTGATGETLKEATKINMSLSALGNVISALVDAKTSFIPYRDSKLTRLLQDSLGGNTKTVMCANVGPVDYNYDETLSTLRYAYRAKSIKNKPRINEDPKDAMIREFQDEIMRLKMKLQEQAAREGGGGRPRQPRVRADGTVEDQEVIVEKEIVEVETVVENEVLVEKVVNRGIAEEDLVQIKDRINEERAEIEAEMAEEKRIIEQQQTNSEEEKKHLLEDLAERKRRREEEAQQQQIMLQRLNAMQEKMLVGSQVMEKAMQQEQELKRAEMEVEERQREELRMKEELEQQVEEKLNLEEKYTSAAEQVQKMTAKLEKLWHRHKQTQQEIQDLQKEFQQEREDMLETIRDLRKELKLVCVTIDNFIPVEQQQQIVERAQYDESVDEWVIAGIDLAGNRLRPNRKKNAANNREASPSALFRGGPQDMHQEHNDAVLMNERPNVYYVYTEDGGVQRAETRPAGSPVKSQKAQRTKSAGRPGTANRKGRGVKSTSLGASGTSTMKNFLHSQPEPEEEEVLAKPFPKARGLVSAS